jgi:hypothetical protein
MAVGDRCQLIMVFPTLDIVAVVTSRNYCSFGKMVDDISAAVKSDTALPPDPAGADLLANAIQNVSIEKPTKTGETPEMASVISGKTYRFPDNALNLKSLTLTLGDSNPRYDLELWLRYQGNSSARFAGPIGLDGLYRKGATTLRGVMGLKGAWSDSHTFVIDVRWIGGDEDRQWTLSFDGDKAHLRGKARGGRDVSVDSEPAG